MNALKKIGLSVLGILVIAQFFGPEKNIATTNSTQAFVAETSPSSDVELLLHTACYDCHSNNTNYLWYSHITPINYWMNDHIEEGKKELNFSEWASYSSKTKKHKMEEIYEEVEEEKMPISSYLITHSEAKLTPEQAEKIVAWAKKNYEVY